MKRTRYEQSLARGQEKDRLLLDLLTARASYEHIKSSLLGLERRWLREARTPAERLAIRRGIAEDLLSQSFRRRELAEEFIQNLRRVRRLGFSNLALRVHVTCMFVQSLPYFPSRTQEAWEQLLETERWVRRLRKGHALRDESIEALAHARHAVGWPLSPEEEAALRGGPARPKRSSSPG